MNTLHAIWKKCEIRCCMVSPEDVEMAKEVIAEGEGPDRWIADGVAPHRLLESPVVGMEHTDDSTCDVPHLDGLPRCLPRAHSSTSTRMSQQPESGVPARRVSPRVFKTTMARAGEKSKPRFEALDTLRGIAALAVSFLHLSFSVPPVSMHPFHLSVDFFLVLSGFVLAQSYTFSTKGLTPWQFIWRRFARLWPLQAYAASVTCLVLVYVVNSVPGDKSTLVNLLSEAALLNGLGLPLPVDVLNSPSWTVSCEFWINVPFAFVAKKVPAITWLTCCVIGQSVLFKQVGSLATTGGLDGLLRCGTSFCLGAACFPLYVGLEAWARPWISSCAFTAAEVVLLVLTGCLFADQNRFASHHDFAAPWLFAAVVMCFACEGGLPSKLLCHLRFLGLISYSLYLNHRMILVLLWPGQPTVLSNFVNRYVTKQPQAILLLWSLLLPYSFVTYHIVEMPSLKALVSLVNQRGVFDGRWTNEGDWGEINGNRFVSMDGLVGNLVVTGSSLVMNINGAHHFGELWEDGNLHWTDGDVWIRVPGEGSQRD